MSKTILGVVSTFYLLVSGAFFLFGKNYDAAILFALWAILLAIYSLGEKGYK